MASPPHHKIEEKEEEATGIKNSPSHIVDIQGSIGERNETEEEKKEATEMKNSPSHIVNMPSPPPHQIQSIGERNETEEKEATEMKNSPSHIVNMPSPPPHQIQSIGERNETEEEKKEATEIKNSPSHIVNIEDAEPDKSRSTSSGEKVQQTEEQDIDPSSPLTKKLSSLGFEANKEKDLEADEKAHARSSFFTRMFSLFSSSEAKKGKDQETKEDTASTSPDMKSSLGTVARRKMYYETVNKGKGKEGAGATHQSGVEMPKEPRRKDKGKKVADPSQGIEMPKESKRKHPSHQWGIDKSKGKDDVSNDHLNVGSTAAFLDPLTPTGMEANTILLMLLAELQEMRKEMRKSRGKASGGLRNPKLAATKSKEGWQPDSAGLSYKGISAMVSGIDKSKGKDDVSNDHLNVGSTAAFLDPLTPTGMEANTILLMLLAELQEMRKEMRKSRGKAKRGKASGGLRNPKLAATKSKKGWQPDSAGLSYKGISAMVSVGLNTIFFTAGITPGHSADTWAEKKVTQIAIWVGTFFAVISIGMLLLINPLTSTMSERTLSCVNGVMALSLTALGVVFSEATLLMSFDRLAWIIGGVFAVSLFVVFLYFKVPLFRALLHRIGFDLTGDSDDEAYITRSRTMVNPAYQLPSSEDLSSDEDEMPDLCSDDLCSDSEEDV